MKKIALLTTVLLLIGTLGAPAAAHDVPRRCGYRQEMGAGWWKLRAHGGVSCRTARRVAEKWHTRVMSGGNHSRFRVKERTWRCRDEEATQYVEAVRVRCRTGEERIVHFLWGS